MENKTPNLQEIEDCIQHKNPKLVIRNFGAYQDPPAPTSLSLLNWDWVKLLAFANVSNLTDVCPPAKNLQSVETLILQSVSFFTSNKLQHFAIQLPKLKNLVFANAVLNYSSFIPKDWIWLKKLTNLEFLSLEGNADALIVLGFNEFDWSFPKISKLSLAGNYPSYDSKPLTADFFKAFPSLEKVHLGAYSAFNPATNPPPAILGINLEELMTICPKLRAISSEQNLSKDLKDWLLADPSRRIEYAQSERLNLNTIHNATTAHRSGDWAILRLEDALSERVCEHLDLHFPFCVNLSLENIHYCWSENIPGNPTLWQSIKKVKIVDSIGCFLPIVRFLSQLSNLSSLEWIGINANSATSIAELLNPANWGFLKQVKRLEIAVKNWKKPDKKSADATDFQSLIFSQSADLEILILGGKLVENLPLHADILKLQKLKELYFLKSPAQIPAFVKQLPLLNTLSLPVQSFQDYPETILGLVGIRNVAVWKDTKKLAHSPLDDLQIFLNSLTTVSEKNWSDLYKLFQNWENGKNFGLDLLEIACKSDCKSLNIHGNLALAHQIEHAPVFAHRKTPLQADQTLHLSGTFKQKKSDLQTKLQQLGFKTTNSSNSKEIDALILGSNQPLPKHWAEKSYQIFTEKELTDWLDLAESKYLATETEAAPEMSDNLLNLLCSRDIQATILACELLESGGIPRQARLLTQMIILVRDTTFYPLNIRGSESEKKAKKTLKAMLKNTLSPQCFKITQASPHPLQQLKMSYVQFKEFFEAWAAYPEIDKLWLLAYVLKNRRDAGKIRGQNYADKYLPMDEKTELAALL